MVKKEHHPTHTWQARNTEAFEYLGNLLSNWKIRNIDIVDIGPGGIAQKYAPFFPTGSETKLGFVKRTKKKIVNAFESSARDQDSTKLVCFEANEAPRALSTIGIERIFFVDKFKKVLDAVGFYYDQSSPFSLIQCDIEREPIIIDSPSKNTRVVISLNVLKRCDYDPNYATNNTLNLVRNEDYLLISSLDDPILSGLTRLACFGDKSEYSIYRRGDRPDKKKEWGRRAVPLDEKEIMERAERAHSGSYQVDI